MLHIEFRVLAMMAALFAPITVAAAEPLSLEEAVAIATAAGDPSITSYEERAAGLEDRAVADSQLPDPKLRLGMMNWPTDTFRYAQEPMTKLEVGVMQAFPKGKTLKHKRERRTAEAAAERTAKSMRGLEIERDVRRAWLDLYYWTGARRVTQGSQAAVSDLVDVVRSFYATGRQSSQDVLRAELELSLLDDRLIETERQIARSRADLARYIGADQAARDAAVILPIYAAPMPLAQMAEALSQHPMVRVQDARIRVRDEDIALARQDYKPGWSVEAAYGARGGVGGADRADLASLMVRLDVPLFTGKRQDKRVSAAKRDRQSAMFDREAKLLELRRSLERAYADWLRFGERVALFEGSVLDQATENADAALDGYRNKTSDFAELIRSRLMELNLELSLLKIRTDRARAEADLIFLQGDM